MRRHNRLFRTARRVLPIGLGALVLTSCAGHAPQDIFRPEGSQAETINELQVPVFIVAGIVGVLVLGAVLFVVIRFRRRDDDDDSLPVQMHGHQRLEVGWTVVPFLILVPIAIATVSVVLSLTRAPDDAMHIAVYGQQWWWSYQYDFDNDGTPDVITANDLVVPVGQKIVLDVQARDVIHSFWIPQLAGTADAVPGHVHELVFEASKVGIFVGQCKEFCGLSHANMRARAVALDDQDWKTWVEQQKQDAQMPDPDTDPVAYAGMQTFIAKCATCHEIRGLKGPDGQPINVNGNAPLVSGYAPDLTHLMSRGVFASGMFDLYVPSPTGKQDLNRPRLEEWLRNPPAVLPMAADQERGMPDLGLSEGEIDDLVAFLSTLGPAPPLQNG
jgi:cytochrome c oxidase subunit 2